MKVVNMVCSGVHRLIPVTDSEQINYWSEKGYTPYKEDGKIVIQEVKTENTIGHIANAELRNAILAEESKVVVSDITKEVTEAYETTKATK